MLGHRLEAGHHQAGHQASTAVSVVCVASWNVDLIAHIPEPLRRGQTQLATGFERQPGGKGSNAAIAAAEGFPVSEAFMKQYRGVFGDDASGYTASMLRDLEAGGRIEADHILGFLLEAAQLHGLPSSLHEAAFLHAKAFEQRRDAKRLPK